MKISPEHWVDKFIRSATNGRIVSVKLRRVLTLIVIPIWFLGLIYSLLWLYVGCVNGYIYWFRPLIEAYNKKIIFSELIFSLLAPAFYLLICFIIPWIIVRLIFWVIDADNVTKA